MERVARFRQHGSVVHRVADPVEVRPRGQPAEKSGSDAQSPQRRVELLTIHPHRWRPDLRQTPDVERFTRHRCGAVEGLFDPLFAELSGEAMEVPGLQNTRHHRRGVGRLALGHTAQNGPHDAPAETAAGRLGQPGKGLHRPARAG